MMKRYVHASSTSLGWVVLAGISLVAACGSDHGGLTPPAGAGGDWGGSAGLGGRATGATASGGSAGIGITGSSGSGGGGSSGTADGGPGGGAGDSIDDGGPPVLSCVYHTDPAVDAGTHDAAATASEGGTGGADAESADAQTGDAPAEAMASDAAGPDGTGSSDGGAQTDGGRGDAGPATSITVLVSPFLGAYLADSNGRVLYTYGGDMAGDCNYAPISGCVTDCIIAWPIFDAGARTLPPALGDGAFGTIQRTDGAFQTTYFGWPLYYFKTDLAPGMLGGQAKSKTWHAATVIPAGVVILKGLTATKYLGDGTGRTLYVFDQDLKGTATSDPTSSCTGSCLTEHPPFWRNRLSVVSSLEPTDFAVFAPSQGRTQLAYKGAPLYFAAADARSGDVNGVTTGWSAVLP